MRVAVIFDNLGPYHRARLEALDGACELLAVEVVRRSREYGWEGVAGECGFRVVTLAQGGGEPAVGSGVLKRVLDSTLDGFGPAVVLVPGWSSQAAFAALRWCVEWGKAAVAMSESAGQDERRVGWKEWVKRRLVGRCAAALVGGRPQAEYLARLGMRRQRIFLGYDVVDNEYFARETARARSRAEELRQRYNLPERFFLASARFIEKKNLGRLIEAYARQSEVQSAKCGVQSEAGWDLVVLGDGVQRRELTEQIARLNLQKRVHLPGFKQYRELPMYYGLAGALVHASTTEPWGLVVNEAMASGLPVLVSNRCGCAPDLVREGVNGFTFDPRNVEQLAGLMARVAGMNDEARRKMGAAGREIIAGWGPERFASGLRGACEAALRWPVRKANWVDRVLLLALMRRE